MGNAYSLLESTYSSGGRLLLEGKLFTGGGSYWRESTYCTGGGLLLEGKCILYCREIPTGWKALTLPEGGAYWRESTYSTVLEEDSY